MYYSNNFIEKEKIKIVFVAPLTQGGGAERIQINIMNSLPDLKYETTFINTGKQNKPDELNNNIRYIQYNKGHSIFSIFKLMKDIKEIKPKYVFTTFSTTIYLLVLIKFISLNKYKLIVRITVPPSELYNDNRRKSKLLFKINSFLLKYSNLVIAQTEFSKIDIVKHYNVEESKIKVVRNIIDHKTLEKKGNEFFPNEFSKDYYNIVSAGALYSVKGFDLLIQAMNSLIKVKENVRLYILGNERYEIGYRKKLLELINEYSLENNIFLIGHKTNPFPYYKNANLFVLPSRKEGFPNVVLEALFYGTPVVVTNCVDFNGIIFDGKNGYVVEKDSAQALYFGIKKSIINLSKLKTLRIENYNYEEIFE